MKSLKSFMVVLVLIQSFNTLADAPRTSSYNPQAAVNYARTYGGPGRNNPSYITFSNDCTNFVSQVLKAGGWRDTVTKDYNQASSWFYTNKSTYSFTWINAGGLKNRFENGYERSLIKLGNSYGGFGPAYLNSQIADGDIISADWEGDGRYDHQMVVTAHSFNETYVTYHSTNRVDNPMSTVAASAPNAQYGVFHVT